jgi:hypothetical protein
VETVNPTYPYKIYTIVDFPQDLLMLHVPSGTHGSILPIDEEISKLGYKGLLRQIKWRIVTFEENYSE